MENISKYMVVVALAMLVSLSVMPMVAQLTEAEGNGVNYDLVHQGDKPYKIFEVHNLGEARAYCWEEENGADGNHVVYVYLIDHNDGNKWYSDEYKSNIRVSGGGLIQENDKYGTYSPYPRDDGDGYNSYWDWGGWTPHNSIGHDRGAYVDVSTMWKYKDWDVSTGGYWDTQHRQGHDDKDWEGTSAGGAFATGNADYIKVEVDEWKMEKRCTWHTKYVTIAEDNYEYLEF